VASSAPANNLGFLGNDERFTTGGALDLIQMGVRLYDPALGRFLEPDPAPGGSANAYDYCYQDPINCFDLGGGWGFKSFFKSLHTVLTPVVTTFQAAALASSFLDEVPVIGEVAGVVQGVSAGLSAINELSECVSGGVSKGGCAVLIANATLTGALPGLGRALGDTIEEGQTLKKAVTVSTEATVLLFEKTSDKLAHIGEPRG
jgi:RHS repeat-associated protein